MTSVDIAALLPELSALEGARLEKAYQHSSTEIRLKLATGSGKRDMIIEAGRRLHLVSNPPPAPPVPRSFPMLLRKELRGSRVGALTQYDFDRVVELQFSRGDERRYLICELFLKGNVVLTDATKTTILPLRALRSASRQISRGLPYPYPLTQLNPTSVSHEEFEAVLASQSRDVVRTLATRFNMGGLYAEEICYRADVDKTKTSLTQDEVRRLFRSLLDVFDPIKARALKPHIVCANDSQPIDVLPFEVSQYERNEKRYFASFNEALDVYFSSQTRPESLAPPSPTELEKIIERQKVAITQFKKQELENQEKGDLIYEEYQSIDQLLQTVRSARVSKSWSEIEKILISLPFVTHVDSSTGVLTLNVKGHIIDIDTHDDVARNAQKYYEKAKVLKQKGAGAERALAFSSRKLSQEEKSKAKRPQPEKQPKAKRKTRWYERYRWFFSTDGFLVLGGKDAETNEEIVKKYMEPRDIFFHAEVHGAPAVLLKSNGKEIPLTTLQEAAQFAISYSTIWKQGLASGRCYWVDPAQVSKTPESGEYVPKGAFVIRGERHYMESQTRLAIGLYEARIIGGPVAAISKKAELVILIQPGLYNQSDVAKFISRALLTAANEDQKKILKKLMPVNEIAKFLPPGNSEIYQVTKEKHEKRQGSARPL